MDTYIIIAACAVAIGIIIALLRTPGLFKKMAGSAAVGYASFGLINVLSSFTGVGLAVSGWNLTIAGLLGLPGVISLLVVKTIIGI